MIIKYTKEYLEPIVKTSYSMAEVCRKCGVFSSGASWYRMKNRIELLGLDTSHFLGKAAHSGRYQTGRCRKKDYKEILVKRTGSRERSKQLRKALLASGREYKCVSCNNLGIWLGKTLQLEIDHINGDAADCTENNLRFLCPNCHTQITTYSKRLDSSIGRAHG